MGRVTVLANRAWFIAPAHGRECSAEVDHGCANFGERFLQAGSKLEGNLNNIHVRGFILTGAPNPSNTYAPITSPSQAACPRNVHVICSAHVLAVSTG